MQTSDYRNDFVHFLAGVGAAVLVIHQAAIAVAERIAHAAKQAQDKDKAAARARALALRERWKAADRPGLQSLGIEAEPKGRGAPLVKQHQLLWDRFACKAVALQRLYAPETSARERLRLLRTETPWFNIFAESLYRGEHLAARQTGEQAPSEAAYRKAAACLMMTPDLLQKICQTVRNDRHAYGEPPERMLLIADFEQWKSTGAFPEHLTTR